jgi:CIC family chloride channel protein
MEASEQVKRWTDRLQEHEDQLFLVLTIAIGAIVGAVIVAFILLTERLGTRMYPAGGAAWRRILVPIAGSLLTGYLLFKFFPQARGSGIPQTKTALFVRNGRILFSTVVGKFFLCSTSLASGIALGREGPSVQIGAGIASVLGRKLGLRPDRVKALVPVGSAAALAAAFNTPIAAVLFTLEEVMGDMHAPVLGSIVLSSATAWMVLHLLLGDNPLFHVQGYQLVHPAEFIIYAILGVLGGLVSVAFVKLLLWQRKKFLALPIKTRAFQPVVGGILVGLLAWKVPAVMGVGYSYVGIALNGQMALKLLILLVVLKLLATTTCYASGNAGGIFGPSLFIGAMLGGTVGEVAHHFFPAYTATAGAYALVGMGTAFAGIIRTPMTSVIMIFEITRDYTIIVPLMISNMIAFILSRKLQPEPIYEALTHQDGIHLPSAEARDRTGKIPVLRAMRRTAEMLSPELRTTEALERLQRMGLESWPVGDVKGLWGMISRKELEEHPANLLSELIPRPVAPRDLMAEDFPHVHTDHSLDLALQRMGETHLDALPVVSRANARELNGVITLDDVLKAYGVAQPLVSR